MQILYDFMDFGVKETRKSGNAADRSAKLGGYKERSAGKGRKRRDKGAEGSKERARETRAHKTLKGKLRTSTEGNSKNGGEAAYNAAEWTYKRGKSKKGFSFKKGTG